MARKTLVWFRQDLRLQDNPALAAAIERGAVVPVFLWSPEREGDWPPGGASRWWLHHALKDLRDQLRERGGDLILRRGAVEASLRALLSESGADAVYWNRRYEPAAIEADSDLKAALCESGFEVRSFNASLLHEPWTVASGSGDPYRVFTPYSKNLLRRDLPEPIDVPLTAAAWGGGEITSDVLEDWALLPKVDWDSGFYKAWNPTRAGGMGRLHAFLQHHAEGYSEARDLPAEDGTSRLSPYLHWGQIGPREIAAALAPLRAKKGGEVFFNEILWREFGYHILFHFPHTAEAPLQAKYAKFPWREDADALAAWQRGQTGFPIVDAGMRQLWATGWMHNRVRMIVASLLVKHLLQPWQAGARWFWDTLVDADLASNSLGWQWAGGCGADAAPYFRIFNPMTQGKKFDGSGEYVRRWVPELARLPDKFLHEPWEAPESVRTQCGVELGETYPLPVIEHKAGRERALAAFQQLKETA